MAEEEARGRRAGEEGAGPGAQGGIAKTLPEEGGATRGATAPPGMGQSSSSASGGGAAAAERRVRGEVEGRGVAVFSKTTCGYCTRGECPPPPTTLQPRALGAGY